MNKTQLYHTLRTLAMNTDVKLESDTDILDTVIAMKDSEDVAGMKDLVKELQGYVANHNVLRDEVDGGRIDRSVDYTQKIPWDSWQNYDKIIVANKQYTKVGDRLYSKHAVDRMQPSGNRFGPNIYQGINGNVYGRSIAPKFVEDVINSVEPIKQENGVMVYISGSVKVVINNQGAVITIVTYRGR